MGTNNLLNIRHLYVVGGWVLFFVLANLNVFCQVFIKEKFFIEPNISFGIMHPKNLFDTKDTFIKYNSPFIFYGGINFNYQINKSFILSTGFLLDPEKTRVKFKNFGSSTTSDHDFGIAFSLIYNFHKNKTLSPLIAFGYKFTYANFNMGHSSSSRRTHYGEDTIIFGVKYYPLNYYRFSYHFCFGIERKFNKGKSIVLYFYLNNGLSNIAKSESIYIKNGKMQYYDMRIIKNDFASFCISYSLPIKNIIKGKSL